MSDWIRIASVAELPADSQRVFTVDGRTIAVFNVQGEFFAIDDACPHRGASLGLGSVSNGCVSCPWHDWAFDLTTGDCHTHPKAHVSTYSVIREGDELLLNGAELQGASDNGEKELPQNGCKAPSDVEKSAETAFAYRYLVRFGVLGWVSYFGSAEWIECAHGDQVAVQTDRGTEVGEILAPAVEADSSLSESAVAPSSNGNGNGNGSHRSSIATESWAGEVLRRLDHDEEQSHRSFQQGVAELVEQAHREVVARSLKLDVIDGEFLFDRENAVLYYLGEPAVELGEVAQHLSRQTSYHVQFVPALDLPSTDHSPGGCGSGKCGSGGCGAD